MLETRLKGLIFSSELHKALYLKNVRPPPLSGPHCVWNMWVSGSSSKTRILSWCFAKQAEKNVGFHRKGISVASWLIFRPHNTKGANLKSVLPDKTAQNFSGILAEFSKNTRNGPEFYIQMDNLTCSEFFLTMKFCIFNSALWGISYWGRIVSQWPNFLAKIGKTLR